MDRSVVSAVAGPGMSRRLWGVNALVRLGKVGAGCRLCPPEVRMPAPFLPADSSLVFPDQRDVIAADARWFQALPAAERWREIFALRHWAARLARSSSRGDAIRRLEDLEETRWQAIQKDLLARHGG